MTLKNLSQKVKKDFYINIANHFFPICKRLKLSYRSELCLLCTFNIKNIGLTRKAGEF